MIGRNEGKTYELVQSPAKAGSHALEGFKCLKCRRTSYHPRDVEHRYCGNCHVFHDDPNAEELWAKKERRP